MQMGSVFIGLVLVAFSMPAAAQSGKVLKGNEITEQALVDALIPPPGTRGIRPGGADVMITFETGSVQLTADGKQKLDIVGRALNTDKLATFTFEVQGHADRRGSSERNQKLSEGRAASVRQYLVSAQRVAPDRLKSVGKGDKEPLNTENPAAAENRRVTFVNSSTN